MNPFFTTIYDWILAHQTLVSLFFYHLAIAVTTSLEMPDNTSSKFYRFFFRLVNKLAANYARSNASQSPVGNLPPKVDDMPVAVPVDTKKKFTLIPPTR